MQPYFAGKGGVEETKHHKWYNEVCKNEIIVLFSISNEYTNSFEIRE